MLTTHYFAFRKYENGNATEIRVEIAVVLSEDVPLEEARQLAQLEIDALVKGHETEYHLAENLRPFRARTDYLFMGVN